MEFVYGPIQAPPEAVHQVWWTEELGECFEESKKKIIGLIEDGVRSFDPQLVTCLSPDWCQDGIGWILQQKVCACDAITPICCPDDWRLVLAGGRFTPFWYTRASQDRKRLWENQVHHFREGFKKKNKTNLGFWPKFGGGRGQRGFEKPNLLYGLFSKS